MFAQDFEEATLPGIVFIAVILSASFTAQYQPLALNPEQLATSAMTFVVMSAFFMAPLLIAQQILIGLIMCASRIISKEGKL